jgi:hypothetical protein
MRKFVFAFATLALITSSVLIGAGTPANAAITCSGTGCDGILAASTQCVKDAQILESDNHYVGSTLVGNLQIKWSPSCDTAWARMVDYIGHNGGALIQSSLTGGDTCDIVTGTTGCNTGMQYVGSGTAFGRATVYSNSSANPAVYTWQTNTWGF